MNKEIVYKVGIAGFGIVGRRRKSICDARYDMEVVALCDKTFSKPVESNGACFFMQTLEELIEFDLDILFVCMSNDMNAVATLEGLKRGFHVFCEKPLARNLGELSEIEKYVFANNDQVLMYGFNHRYHDSVIDALNIVQSGKLGKILNLRGVYGKSKIKTFNQTDWRTSRELAGGGILLDQGIHMVDLLRLFAGEFCQVKSFVRNDFWGYDVEDNAHALLLAESGAVASIHSSATQWQHRFSLEIGMAEGALVLDGILTGSKSYGDEKLRVIIVDHESDLGDPREEITHYNKDLSWEREVDSLVKKIEKEDLGVGAGFDDAYKSMHLVESIYYADDVWRDFTGMSAPGELKL